MSRKTVTVIGATGTAGSACVDELIPALLGTHYRVSCVPYSATESQYPLIFAAREAGVERFVPSEFGAISSRTCRRTRCRAMRSARSRRPRTVPGTSCWRSANSCLAARLQETAWALRSGRRRTSCNRRAPSRKSWPSACSAPRVPSACRSGRTGTAHLTQAVRGPVPLLRAA
jgi:hypothetical protein